MLGLDYRSSYRTGFKQLDLLPNSLFIHIIFDEFCCQ